MLRFFYCNVLKTLDKKIIIPWCVSVKARMQHFNNATLFLLQCFTNASYNRIYSRVPFSSLPHSLPTFFGSFPHSLPFSCLHCKAKDRLGFRYSDKREDPVEEKQVCRFLSHSFFFLFSLLPFLMVVWFFVCYRRRLPLLIRKLSDCSWS